MEMFVRVLLMAVVPVFQLMMVVWRVQQKTRMSIGATAVLCFFLTFLFANWAATVYPEKLSPCIGCAADHGTNGAFVAVIALFSNWLFNLIVSLLALNEYKVALKRLGLR